MDALLAPRIIRTSLAGSRPGYRNDPMRFRSPKFIQMKNARPMMFWSGTKPQ
jgi:hypothetical protein